MDRAATPAMLNQRAMDEFRYQADPWCRGFCKGYLVAWRILKLFGVDLDELEGDGGAHPLRIVEYRYERTPDGYRLLERRDPTEATS